MDKNITATGFNSYFTIIPSILFTLCSRVSSIPLAEKLFFSFPMRQY